MMASMPENISKRQPLPNLTASQFAALRSLQAFIRKNGFAPTQVELGRELGISGPAAAAAISRLASRNLIESSPRTARSLVITTRGQRVIAKQALSKSTQRSR